MCLAIPAQVVEWADGEPLAMVEVSGVRRRVNVDLVREDGLAVGDWVLLHVGFALSKVSPEEAQAQLRLLAAMEEDELALEEVRGYVFD